MGRGIEKAKQDSEDWKSNKIALGGLNVIGDNAYFIRLKDKKNFFLHPDPSKETEKEITYVVAEGEVGAAIFHKKQAENFIFHSFVEDRAGNLEMVAVKEIIGRDNSEN